MYIYIYIKNIRKPYNATGKPCENDPESRWANKGGRLTKYENLTKPSENHTKTTPKADKPTRGTIQTIRKPYNHRKTIRKRAPRPINQRVISFNDKSICDAMSAS